MGNLNRLYKLKNQAFGKHAIWQEALEAEVACVAPFAPHIAEELWQALGHSTSVHHDSWPQWDDKLAAEDEITVVVQINGKVRANLILPAGVSKEAMVEAAKNDEKIQEYLKDAEVKKTIAVEGKLVNFVI